jgi:predicted flap endonuclease-1-like 5' DNA nuclease
MTFLAEYELPILIAALLIGIITAFWLFRGRAAAAAPRETMAPMPPLAPAPPPARRRQADGGEGNAVGDEYADAAKDVAGEILGIDAHPADPSGPPDDLQRLKGVGPKLAAQLAESGIIRYGQLARLNPNEIALLDERMGAFRGRIERDRLVEQARYLERGDLDGFEAEFGKLGG